MTFALGGSFGRHPQHPFHCIPPDELEHRRSAPASLPIVPVPLSPLLITPGTSPLPVTRFTFRLPASSVADARPATRYVLHDLLQGSLCSLSAMLWTLAADFSRVDSLETELDPLQGRVDTLMA